MITSSMIYTNDVYFHVIHTRELTAKAKAKLEVYNIEGIVERLTSRM